ncbi:MAG TPA: hypothetical protein P5543_11250 [Planctomycetota bacterium]|nr:hypothetical protein [Planctomycetota bacterium]HRU52753.1 hypothetical protein [Planctomycetota bacterium]
MHGGENCSGEQMLLRRVNLEEACSGEKTYSGKCQLLWGENLLWGVSVSLGRNLLRGFALGSYVALES